MREANDWRLTNQLSCLGGVVLSRKTYSQSSERWDHDHCAFCWAKVMDRDDPEVRREGYATQDEYHWICPTCFEDFRDVFRWTLK